MSNIRLNYQCAERPVALENGQYGIRSENPMPQFGLPEAKSITYGASCAKFLSKKSKFYNGSIA